MLFTPLLCMVLLLCSTGRSWLPGGHTPPTLTFIISSTSPTWFRWSMVVCWFFSPVTESAANKPAASRRSHLAAGDRVRQVGCQDSSSRLRHYSVGKLMHISLAVWSMVRPISHGHEHSEHKCLHLRDLGATSPCSISNTVPKHQAQDV